MAEEIRDIFQGIETFFAGEFSNLEFRTGQTVNVNVKLGYKDERVESARSYPEVTVILYDALIDNNRRYSGMIRTQTDNPDGETTVLGKLPIPVNMHFQLDTYATNRDHDWALVHKCLQLFGMQHAKIVTQAGRVLYIVPQSMDMLDKVENNAVFRKVYRFYVPIWFANPAAAETAYLVLSRELDMLGENYVMPEPS